MLMSSETSSLCEIAWKDCPVSGGNLCRNRHCPCCQGADRARWVAAREKELLPIPYLHLVTTVPHALLPVFRAHPRQSYDALMQASRQAIADCCRDDHRLGFEVGQIQVLHTWGSDLKLHPHVHTVVTGGGLTPDGRWKDARRTGPHKQPFLIPINMLRMRFRTILVSLLQPLWQQLPAAGTPEMLQQWRQVINRPWVVYAKRPFGSAQVVLRYLGRYTHRVALDPGRLEQLNQHTVALTYKDYRRTDTRNRPVTKQKHMDIQTFLHQFAQHILPKGFRRIRTAGILAPRCRAKQLATARHQLRHRTPVASAYPITDAAAQTSSHSQACPKCHHQLIVASISRPLPHGGKRTVLTAAYHTYLQTHTEPYLPNIIILYETDSGTSSPLASQPWRPHRQPHRQPAPQTIPCPNRARQAGSRRTRRPK